MSIISCYCSLDCHRRFRFRTVTVVMIGCLIPITTQMPSSRFVIYYFVRFFDVKPTSSNPVLLGVPTIYVFIRILFVFSTAARAKEPKVRSSISPKTSTVHDRIGDSQRKPPPKVSLVSIFSFLFGTDITPRTLVVAHPSLLLLFF